MSSGIISSERIKKARSCYLPELLNNIGYTLKKEGEQFRVVGNDGLFIKADKWYKHSTSHGGNPIDLLMYLKRTNFKNAVKIIERENCELPAKLPEQSENSIDERTKEVSVEVERYLTEERRIDSELINDLICVDFIREIYPNKVAFAGYRTHLTPEKRGKIKCLSWRSIKNNMRGESKGSDKSFSFSIPDCKQKNRTIILVESPIDALSVACLENMKHKNGYYQTLKIALCGTGQNNLKERLKKLNPKRILLALDNDRVGRSASKKLKKELAEIATTEIITCKDKDPNDLLRRLKSS
jgi:hypothetical protein